VEALEGKKIGKRIAAFEHVNRAAAMVRHAAPNEDQREVVRRLRLVFGRSALTIERAVRAGLRDPSEEVRFLAGGALLVLDPGHKEAAATLAASLRTRDFRPRAERCETIGFLRIDHSDVLFALSECIRAKEGRVRRAGARAVMEIGAPAKSMVPALVGLLSSKDARGDCTPFWTIAPAIEGNLAVLALSAIGADASTAVPPLLKLLDKAGESERKDILTCLGKMGPVAQGSVMAVQRQLKSASTEVRLRAAAALVCIAPGNRSAIAVLRHALTGADEVCIEALTACFDVRVVEKLLLPDLIALLRHGNEDVRTRAALTLSVFGPDAARAIPALERILLEEEHSFGDHAAAGICLAQIGTASLPALIRVARNTDAPGWSDATLALGSFPKDAAMVVPVLMRCLSVPSVIALGRLGKEARQARFSLLKIYLGLLFESDYRTAEYRCIAHWAFQQVN